MTTSGRPIGWLVLVTRVALGGLFIFAGVNKLLNPQHFLQAIDAFKIIPKEADHLSVVGAFTVPWIEILAGAMLVLGWWARASALVIGSLLLVFLGAIISVLARDLSVSCSCFGKFEIPCTGPIGVCHIVRNAVLLALAIIVIAWGPGPLALDRESTK